MSNLPVPHIENNDNYLSSQPFGSWVRNQTALFVSQILSFIGFLSFIGTAIYYTIANYNKVEPAKNLEFIQYSIYIAHLFILPIFIGWLIGIIDNDNEDLGKIKLTYKRIFNQSPSSPKAQEETSKEQLRKFKVYFFWFWIVMYCLYVVFTVSAYYQSKSDSVQSKTQTSIKSGSSKKQEKVNSSQDIRIYIEVNGINANKVNSNQVIEGVSDEFQNQNQTSISSEDTNTSKKPQDKTISRYLFPFLTFAMNNLGSIFIYCCFTVLFLPSIRYNAKIIQKLHIFFWTIFILLFTLSFWVFLFINGVENTDYYEHIIIFDAISGVINALVLALLIARLDSKLIGLPSYLISVLYIYAAIQPLFVVFELSVPVSEMIKTSVLIFVFIFKIHFFLIITYALQTGRMLNYLYCFPALNERVDSLFANQFEIRTRNEHGKFGYDIYRKNEKIYIGKGEFLDETDCKMKIKELKKIIKNASSVQIDRNLTPRVRILDRNKKELCVSDPFRSRKNAEKLKRESIEKIPHCNVL